MEAVAMNSLLGIAARQREGLGQRGLRSVEGGVEARHLRDLRQHEGTRYVFCSRRCFERFETSPGAYLAEVPPLLPSCGA